tara:strand:- start:143 stop:1210 length:1068 start_codon:yes stop_codon:yes gene_type:complete
MKNKDLIYNLVPQQKFYDSMGADWKPIIMFNQFPNIRSKYCNTDTFGLRFNNLKDNSKKISIFENTVSNKKKNAIIIGNSTSFGEGQSSDEKTISNFLTENSEYNFYNFSGRGFSGFQEIAQFLILSHNVLNLDRIIAISGVNDSYLPYFIDKFDYEQTPIFGYDKFLKTMSNASRGWKNKIFKALFGNFLKNKKKDWDRINSLNWRDELFGSNNLKSEDNIAVSKDVVLKQILERNINIWSFITKGMNIKFDYILQPVGSWCKSTKTKEEEAIFNEENNLSSNQKIYKYVDHDKYLLVKKILRNAADKNGLNFYDMNEEFNNDELKEKWLFTSRLHLSDMGSEILSKKIIEKIL